MVPRLQKFKKVTFSTKKRVRAHFCSIFIKLNFAVTINNVEFTCKKTAFYDNSRLYFNTVQIFARATRFVPPPNPFRKQLLFLFCASPPTPLESNCFSYVMPNFDPEKRSVQKTRKKTN